MKVRLFLAVTAAAGALAAPASGSGSAVRWFLTPGKNGANCELGLDRPGFHPATYAFCVVGNVGVMMNKTGKFTKCHGCSGDAPEYTPTLQAGRSIGLGPFRCTALRAGVRCVVKKSGRGFRLSPHGVTRVG